jgi:hypothetical protein
MDSFAGSSNSTEYLKQLKALESALDHIFSGSSNPHRPGDHPRLPRLFPGVRNEIHDPNHRTVPQLVRVRASQRQVSMLRLSGLSVPIGKAAVHSGGWKAAGVVARPHHRLERASCETATGGIRPLLPRGPDLSRAGDGNTGEQEALHRYGPSAGPSKAGRPASPLDPHGQPLEILQFLPDKGGSCAEITTFLIYLLQSHRQAIRIFATMVAKGLLL